MRKLLAVSLLFVATTAKAWEFPRNPDRFPSIGVHAINESLSGDRTAINQPTPVLTNMADHGDMKDTALTVGGDVRLPVNDGITLTFSFDSVSSENTFTRDQNVYKSTDKVNGYRYGIGLRLYLNK